MKSQNLKRIIREALQKLKKKKQLNEVVPLVAWAIGGYVIGAVSAAWGAGWFDSSVPPPNPGNLPFEELNKIVNQFGESGEGLNQWNSNPRLAYDMVQNPNKYKSDSRRNSKPMMESPRNISIWQLIKWAIGNDIIARGTTPSELDPQQIDQLRSMYDGGGVPSGGSPGPTIPPNRPTGKVGGPYKKPFDVDDLREEGMMCEMCGEVHEGSCGMNERMTVSSCKDECQSDFDGNCGDAAPLCDECQCKDGTSYKCCGGAERNSGRTMGPYRDKFDIDDLRENINSSFISNLENVYASKGCKGLKKKNELFENKLRKINSRQGSQTINWSGPIQEKLTHIEGMMSNLECDSNTNSSRM